jgi:transcriptional regulator with XRE-family HTH domain
MTKNIGNRIKKLRMLKGWTQEYVADYLCISQPTYARIENGKNKTWLNHIDKLCKLYNISAHHLFQFETPMHSTTEILIRQLERRITENEKTIQALRKKINLQELPKIAHSKTA